MLTLGVMALIACWAGSPAQAQGPNCPGANPDDSIPDSAALQSCLDSMPVVILDGNSGGVYLIDSPGYGVPGLTMPSGRTLTSVGGNRPVLKAAANLQGPILSAPGASDFTISRVMFYGDVYGRLGFANSYCVGTQTDGKRNGYNVIIEGGSRFTIDDVEVRQSLCGAGMAVDGQHDFEIKNSWFYYNGRSKEEAGGEPWADGLTLWNCGPNNASPWNGVAQVHDNHLQENTDVNLIVGGGSGCRIYNNTISNFSRYAFAGFMAEAFGGVSSDFSGSDFQGNHVSSGFNRIGFGIMIGPHPWHPGATTSNVSFTNGSSTGAVVNLAVDGAVNATVQGVSVSGAQGNDVLQCPGQSRDFIVAHSSGSIQGGGTPYQYHQPCGAPQ